MRLLNMKIKTCYLFAVLVYDPLLIGTTDLDSGRRLRQWEKRRRKGDGGEKGGEKGTDLFSIPLFVETNGWAKIRQWFTLAMGQALCLSGSTHWRSTTQR